MLIVVEAKTTNLLKLVYIQLSPVGPLLNKLLFGKYRQLEEEGLTYCITHSRKNNNKNNQRTINKVPTFQADSLRLVLIKKDDMKSANAPTIFATKCSTSPC